MADLNLFKKDCIELDPEDMVQKYLLDGHSYFFINDNEDEYQFKKDIAKSLNVHIRDIAIVGSGKLGFSIKPDKVEPGFFPFYKFDQNDISDLDIAIVSDKLFDAQLVHIYSFTSQYLNKEVWRDQGHRNSFAKYILKGWLVPKFIPKDYELTKNINLVQAEYKRKFGRDINIGIYKSWFYFENYHINNIRKIHLNLIANV